MGKPKKINWSQVQTDYVTSDVSYAFLAEKYGVSNTMMCQMGREQKWVEKRKEYRRTVCKKAIDKIGEKQSKYLAKVIGATNDAAEIISDALGNREQFYTYITEKTEMYGDGVTSEVAGSEEAIVTMRKWSEEQRFSKLDTKALREATQTLKELTVLLRDFYDIPTVAQTETREIAKQRLELDKRKLEASIRDDDDENETGIILMPLRKNEETNSKQ